MLKSTLKSLSKWAREPARIEDAVEKLKAQAPTPTLWLLGKTQSGKSSVIRTLTNRTDVEIGNGFRPQTKFSSSYNFPSDETPLLEFLDTRGFGEAHYDPEEDLQYCAPKAQALLVTVKISDHATEEVVQVVSRIKNSYKHLPVIVVLTCLHELYSSNENHPMPYPFVCKKGKLLESAPTLFQAHIEEHLQTIGPYCDYVVPVDYTLREDGFEPHDYGRAALLRSLYDILPKAIWNALLVEGEPDVARSLLKSAHPSIVFYSLLSGSSAAIPVPLVELPVIAAVQLKMLHSLAAIYNQKMSYARLAEIVATLGFSYTWRLGARSMMKFIPGGNIAYASITTASTYALGHAMCSYFRHLQEGLTPDREQLRKIFKDQLQESRNIFEVNDLGDPK